MEANSDLSAVLIESSSDMSGVGRVSFVGAVNDWGWESGTRSLEGEVAAAEDAVGRGGVCKSAGKAFSLLLLGGIELVSCNCDEEGSVEDGSW